MQCALKMDGLNDRKKVAAVVRHFSSEAPSKMKYQN